MSFRETRNFLEKMRALGYAKPIYMDSFRTPDFGLVAELLFWLVKSYDPLAELSLDIGTEADRIHFIKSVALIMASKGHLMLHTKKLYQADGYAVKELLKIANLLCEAKNALKRDALVHGDSESVSSSLGYDLGSKLSNLKESRLLAVELAKQGAGLYDLLEQEIDLRESRLNAISKQLELPAVEGELRKQSQWIRDQVQAVQQGAHTLASDGQNLTAKIEKKKQEYERLAKRLSSLQGVRPAFMDEYERLESEIRGMYGQYVSKFRNLAYLEHQMDVQKAQEKELWQKREATLRELQNNVRQQELQHLRGDGSMSQAEMGGGSGSNVLSLGVSAGDSTSGVSSGDVFPGSAGGNRNRSASRLGSTTAGASTSANNSRQSIGGTRPRLQSPSQNPTATSATPRPNTANSNGQIKQREKTPTATTTIRVKGSMLDEQEEEEQLTLQQEPARGVEFMARPGAASAGGRRPMGKTGAPMTTMTTKPPSKLAQTSRLAQQPGRDDDEQAEDDDDDDFGAEETESLMLPEASEQSTDLNDF